MSPTTESQPLQCPTCARRFPLSERFCPECEMPLVYGGRREEQPITEAHERARKVRPEYVGGELMKAGWARNQAEAELIQGILLEEGVPSVQRRSRGFDVPDFLAGGPRDILVPEAAYEAARGLLSATEAPGAPRPDAGGSSPVRLAVALLIALALAGAIVYALSQLAS